MSDEKMTGSCHCGQISYTTSEEKQFEFLCHCSNCRKLNGGGHLSGIMVPKEGFEVTGEPRIYSYPGGSGKPIEVAFCPNCGTMVYAHPTAFPEAVVIRANTLDNAEVFEPKQSLFPEEAFSWDNCLISG